MSSLPAGGCMPLRLDRGFAALADPTRRALLDRLLARDGQRMSELVTGFEMSRQAVSKHLQVLEGAELVSPHREGGETRYRLNRVRIRELEGWWVEKLMRHPGQPRRAMS